MKRNKRKKTLECINGVRGAISLFLAVLMTPFLTIALLLVEAGRYNSSVSLLDEAMGVSSYSVLADYDSYLLKRWGVLGLSQEGDISKKFSDYMTENTSVGGSALTWSNPTIEGIYPLSDTSILHNQIMEYSKLNVPTQLASRLFSVFGDAFKNMDKKAELEDVLANLTGFAKSADSAVETLTAGVKVLDGGITLAKSAEAMRDSAEKLEKLKEQNREAYNSFASNVNNLIYWYGEKVRLENALIVKEAELPQLEERLESLSNESSSEERDAAIDELEDEISIVKADIRSLNRQINTAVSNISAYKTSSVNAKNQYASKLGEIVQELTTFRDTASAALKARKSVTENIIGGIQSGIETSANYKSYSERMSTKQEDLKAIKAELERWEDRGETNNPSYNAGVAQKVSLENEIKEIQEELRPLETQIAVAKGGKTALEGMNKSFGETFEDYDESVITNKIADFTNLKTKVSDLNIDGINRNSPRIT